MSYRGFEPSNWNLTGSPGEGKVFGRLAESRTNGAFAHAGLLGWCFDNAEVRKLRALGTNMDARQLQSYVLSVPYQLPKYFVAQKAIDPARRDFSQNTILVEQALAAGHQLSRFALRDGHYHAYWSQSGLQALIYFYLDKVYHDPLILRFFCVFFMACVLTAWLLLVFDCFGRFAAVLSYLGVLSLSGLLGMGDNIGQVVGANYLVMVAFWWAFKTRVDHLGRLTFALIFFKFLINGAEFAFAVLLLPFVPLVFFSVLHATPWKATWNDAVVIAKAIVAASLAAFTVLALQILAVTHSGYRMMAHFVERIQYRTLVTTTSDGVHFRHNVEATQTTTAGLLRKYLDFTAVEIGDAVATYGQFIVFVGAVSLLAACICRWRPRRELIALMIAMWASIMCPLTWILLAKGHSLTETGVDRTVWNLPFMLLAIVFIAVTIRDAYSTIRDVCATRLMSRRCTLS